MKLSIEDEGEVYLFGRKQAYLFTYSGKLACYDHVYLELPEVEDEPPLAIYIWSDDDDFDRLADAIIEHDFPCFLNMFKVGKQVKETFRWHMGLEELDVVSTFPDGWLNESP